MTSFTDFRPTVKSVRIRHVVNWIFRGVGKGVKLKNPLGESTSIKCNSYVNMFPSNPFWHCIYGNKYQTFFTWNGKFTGCMTLPKIKHPHLFFSPKVLAYIMEITLNHKFCGQTTCQSLSAANSGFQIWICLSSCSHLLVTSFTISFSATLASAFLKKMCPKEMGVFH